MKSLILFLLFSFSAAAQVTLNLGSIRFSAAEVAVIELSPVIQSQADPNPDDGIPATRTQIAAWFRSETRRVIQFWREKAIEDARKRNKAELLSTEYANLVSQLEAIKAQIAAIEHATPTEGP